MSNKPLPFNILLVEDNPGDILLTKEVLKELKLEIDLGIAMDGEEAINYLEKTGKFEKVLTPQLILLDLNLPKKDGREVLKHIKSNQKLRSIPVCVLTSSDAEKDIQEVYKLSANCYITKPLDFNNFLRTFNSLLSFWFNIVRLPNFG